MDDFSLYFHRSVLSRLQRNPRGVRCVVPSLLIVQNICRARTGLVNPRIPLRPKRNNGILHFIRGSRVPWYPSFSQLPFVSNSNVARESNVRDSRTTSRCDVAISESLNAMRSTVDFAFRVRVGRGVLIIIFISRADHHASLRILLGSYVELNLTCLLCCFFSPPLLFLDYFFF